MEPQTVVRGVIAGRPINSPVELAQYLQAMCGADGYRIEAGYILALRWDTSGSETIIDRFAWET